jgi:hypothetical protein
MLQRGEMPRRAIIGLCRLSRRPPLAHLTIEAGRKRGQQTAIASSSYDCSFREIDEDAMSSLARQTPPLAAKALSNEAPRDEDASEERAANATPPAQPNTRGVALPLVLAIYNVILGGAASAAFALLIWAWGKEGGAEPDALQTLRFLALSADGAVIGATIHCLFGLHMHVAVLADFNPRFSASYILGPLVAAMLGMLMFLILHAGLFALGTDPVSTSNALRASLFYTAVGALTGLAWDSVILRLDAVAGQIFGAPGPSFIKLAFDRTTPRDAGRQEE